ncbi:hypothetical protein [Deinococcus sp. QL22]|uniref:hypothetical protein n=1 Tax=Deinococcus sp. QL22 TaxID=2939437 RepID=UPI0020180684|nr:hypothetical protein [Deinococcus sp. QL22]UQN08014.1 hypothetical protein M1R55_18140 [Deinococcus sp. QL22]
MFHAPAAPCPTCAERTRRQTEAREMLAKLTPWELNVVRLVAEGLTNNEVSVRLNRCIIGTPLTFEKNALVDGIEVT